MLLFILTVLILYSKPLRIKGLYLHKSCHSIFVSQSNLLCLRLHVGVVIEHNHLWNGLKNRQININITFVLFLCRFHINKVNYILLRQGILIHKQISLFQNIQFRNQRNCFNNTPLFALYDCLLFLDDFFFI